jgi:hypothetical protein
LSPKPGCSARTGCLAINARMSRSPAIPHQQHCLGQRPCPFASELDRGDRFLFGAGRMGNENG